MDPSKSGVDFVEIGYRSTEKYLDKSKYDYGDLPGRANSGGD